MANGPQSETIAHDHGVSQASPSALTRSNKHLTHWRLALRPTGDDPAYTILAEGTQPVTRFAAHEFDPTLLMNGMYKLVLEGTDANGAVSTDTNNLIVKAR